jgi:hypothetical protein
MEEVLCLQQKLKEAGWGWELPEAREIGKARAHH